MNKTFPCGPSCVTAVPPSIWSLLVILIVLLLSYHRVLNSEASLGWDGQREAPQQVALGISLNYIYKFLTLCAFARPGAYTDGNLLGLIELLCRAGLDVGLRLLPKTDLQQLLLQLLENIQEWPEKLPKLCRALSWVSDHHHNLLALVQFFLDVTTRSRQLRSQLSLEVIARMLGQQESLPPWQENTQLSLLSRLLSLMRPSSLGQYLSSELSPPCQEQQPKASTDLDHKNHFQTFPVRTVLDTALLLASYACQARVGGEALEREPPERGEEVEQCAGRGRGRRSTGMAAGVTPGPSRRGVRRTAQPLSAWFQWTQQHRPEEPWPGACRGRTGPLQGSQPGMRHPMQSF